MTGGSIDYIGAYLASNGQTAVDLDRAFSTGGLSQTFGTSRGTGYLVAFDLSGNPDGAPRIKNVRVTVSVMTHEFSFDTTGQSRTDLRWKGVSFALVATGATTTLMFASLSPGGNSWDPFSPRIGALRNRSSGMPYSPHPTLG